MRVKNRWAVQGIGDAHHCFARVTAYSEEIRARSPVLGSCEFAIHFAVESATLDIKVLISAVAPFGRMRDASKSLHSGQAPHEYWARRISRVLRSRLIRDFGQLEVIGQATKGPWPIPLPILGTRLR